MDAAAGDPVQIPHTVLVISVHGFCFIINGEVSFRGVVERNGSVSPPFCTVEFSGNEKGIWKRRGKILHV